MSTHLEVVNHLISNGVGTALGTDWFIQLLPDRPNVCQGIFPNGGPPPVRDIGSSTWSREFPTVQLRFRGAPGDTEEPRVRAQAAYEAVALIMATTLDGTFYYVGQALQSPFMLEKDDADRAVWVFNAGFEKELS
jgi:hypothetical protein